MPYTDKKSTPPSDATTVFPDGEQPSTYSATSPWSWRQTKYYLKNRLAPPGIRALLVYLGLLFTFLTYGWANFYRDPGSIFFDESRAYERWYSQWRDHQAEMFWLGAESAVARLDAAGLENGSVATDKKVMPGLGGTINPLSMGKVGPEPEICVAFMTVERKGIKKQYIDHALASTLTGLTAPERRSLHLLLLFASSNPSTHPTYSSPILPHLLDTTLSYLTPNLTTPDLLPTLFSHEANLPRTSHQKGVLDYTLALSQCLLSAPTAPYIAIFEDDILLAEGWLARTLLNLRQVTHQMATRYASSPTSWLYLRLFNQERSIGWSGNRVPFAQNEHWLILGITMPTLNILLFLRRKSRPLRARLTNGVLLVAYLLLIPTAVLLFFQAGKASLLPHTSGVFDEPFGCCSQALVFNRAQVPGLIQYLRQNYEGRPDLPTEERRNEVGKYDMMTRDFARISGLRRWSAYPVVVQHVGAKSSIDAKEGESKAIWSMAFENLNPKKLAREHARMVKELFGK